MASASCGRQRYEESMCRWGSQAGVEVSTVEDTDEEGVLGPPTGKTLPADELRETIERLWDEGNEQTVYMLEGAMRECRTMKNVPSSPRMDGVDGVAKVWPSWGILV